MILGGVVLFILAFVLAVAGTFFARRYARRLGLMDAPGERKVHVVATPRNGGIGIFVGFAGTLVAGLGAVWMVSRWLPPESQWRYTAKGALADPTIRVLGLRLPGEVLIHVPGMWAHVPVALLFLAGVLATHLLGLWDDRKAMAAWPKLLLQVAIAVGVVGGGELIGPGTFRVLTMLGNFPSWGFWPSAALSVMWIVALTNAFNFLDNMDGLSAGVAFICAAMFLVAASFSGQWFVAGLLVIFMGAVLGFLCFNFPPASIFMGDGGSMLLGFILATLTIRTTYYEHGRSEFAVLMPLFVTAVPLYDLVIVSLLRLVRGRSPMRGDTNHFSHRLTRHGFSKRSAVLVIYGVTLATGIGAPLLARADSTSALLLALQLVGMLTVIGVLERVGEHTQ